MDSSGARAMTSGPLVSILTPIRNGITYVEQCIQSVLSQSYSNIEHVFADGGSTDGTLELLAQYGAKFPERIRFTSEPDNGVGSALKRAYRQSRGQIFGWIDSDDRYEPDAIEAAVNYFLRHPEWHYLYGGCNLIDAANDVVGCFVIRDFDKQEWLTSWHYIVFCATFFRRDVVERVGFVNDLGNDLDFYLRVGKRFTLHRVDHTFTNWRLHEGSISLKKAPREHDIRWNRAKEDFYLVLRHGGSIVSPRALTYYGLIEPSISRKLGFLSPVLKKIDHHLKASMYASHREHGSYAYPLAKKIARDYLGSVRNVLAGVRTFENRFYDSANDGSVYQRAGQRIDGIAAGSVVEQVMLSMDKVGSPRGLGSCVVRKVSDDSVVGTLGTVDVAELPDASAPRPKWVVFNAGSVEFPESGDYRMVLEWDPAGTDGSNYPRVRYNNADTIDGVFTQYEGGGKWVDRTDSDTSIRMRIARRRLAKAAGPAR